MVTSRPAAPQEEYHVRLSSFEGPLDLLLFLVRRAEVDIHDIPVAEITDQYLGFLGELDRIDIDLAGEFLLMAATLVEIKSRTLSPSPEGESGAGTAADPVADDPRGELIRQLLAYERYRAAAERLERLRTEFAARHPIRSGLPAEAPGDSDGPEPSPELELEDVHVADLLEAYGRIVATIDFTRIGDHAVEYDDTPISLYQEDLVDRLGRLPERRVELRELFRGQPRHETIGLFLATLELLRQGKLVLRLPEGDAGDDRLAIELAPEFDLPPERSN